MHPIEGIGNNPKRTPVGETSIVLNPKVDETETVLTCPQCDEEIQCWSAPDGFPIEYRCGCDQLRRFKVRGTD